MKKLAYLLLATLLITSCSDDDTTTKPKEIVEEEIVEEFELDVVTNEINFNHKDIDYIEAYVNDQSSIITYKTNNEYTASVDNTGKVTAGLVGKTDIIVSSNDIEIAVPVTVEAKYNIFTIEAASFGSSREEILAKHSDITPSMDKVSTIDPKSHVIIYQMDNYNLYYTIDIENDQLRSYSFYGNDINDIGEENVAGFFEERYIFLKLIEETGRITKTYKSADNNLEIDYLLKSDGFFMLAHYDVSVAGAVNKKNTVNLF